MVSSVSKGCSAMVTNPQSLILAETFLSGQHWFINLHSTCKFAKKQRYIVFLSPWVPFRLVGERILD